MHGLPKTMIVKIFDKNWLEIIHRNLRNLFKRDQRNVNTKRAINKKRNL